MKKLLFGILVICFNNNTYASGEENGNDCESSYTLTTTNSNC